MSSLKLGKEKAIKKRQERAEKWLTVKTVAAYLGLHPGTIYHYVENGTIPHYRIPGSNEIRFAADEIDQWVRNN